MADDRLLHKKLGHSEKVNLLTADEEIAWVTYILNADDFGVMPFGAFTIQHAHDRLASKPTRTVQRMLYKIRDIGLIRIFNHQNRTYCYQHNWQDYQKVRYPLPTVHPRIPDALLRDCTRATQWLHTVWPGGAGRDRKLSKWFPPDAWPLGSGTVTERSGTVPECSEMFRATRAGGHDDRDRDKDREGEEARGSEIEELDAALPEPSKRAGAFCDWYAAKHEQLFHVGYIGAQKDYQAALQLVATFSDQELRDAALVWFGQDDAWASKGTRTIPKFASRASDCLLQAKRELAKASV